MKVFQGLVEKTLYILLMLVLVVNIVLCIFLYANSVNNKRLITTIDRDQKTYIACLLAINPHQPLKPQEQSCYNKSP